MQREQQKLTLGDLYRDALPGDTRLYRGDRLELEPVLHTTGWRVSVMRRGHRLGLLDLEISKELAKADTFYDTWGAYVADPGPWGDRDQQQQRFAVWLKPFDLRPCGCLLNLGGYHVRRCPDHGAPELGRAEWEGHGEPGWDDDPRREQETEYRRMT